MKRKILFVCILLIGMAAFAQESSAAASATASAAGAETSAVEASNTAVFKYFAAALAVGISCIAGGIAVARIGSAAMGAMSENADLSGKALPYAGLAEGICLWGFLVALLILFL